MSIYTHYSWYMYLKLCGIIGCRSWNLSSVISSAIRNPLPQCQSATNPIRYLLPWFPSLLQRYSNMANVLRDREVRAIQIDVHLAEQIQTYGRTHSNRFVLKPPFPNLHARGLNWPGHPREPTLPVPWVFPWTLRLDYHPWGQCSSSAH
jgi:hypothetical protein